MESNRGQGSIQQLLAAEVEAQHIVNAARTGNFKFFFSFASLVFISETL